MQEYNTIIGKLLSGINRRKFNRITDKYKGNFAVKKLTCWEQFVAVFLGQVTNCSSLREIVDTVNVHSNQHYHLGIKNNIARSTLALANANRNWKIYRDVFFDLIKNLKEFREYKEFINIIDSTPIRLDLTTHPWVETTMKVVGLKVHVVFNLDKEIPTYFDITGARTNDVTIAQNLEIKEGITYVADKGYTDYNWWNKINEAGAYFVTRLKKNAKIRDLTPEQRINNKISSQIFELTNTKPRGGKINEYANKPLRKVYIDRTEEGKSPLILVTNDFTRSAEEIAELYKQRWQIELFFKWIKQNLKIKKFLGKSENAIKTQICIALISFVLLQMAQELKEICGQISTKNLLKIIGNSLFTCLKVRNYGRRRYKNPNQLQFQWVLQC